MMEKIPEKLFRRFLTKTQSGNLKYHFGLKFCGVLKNQDVKRNDREFIEFLIAQNIYVENAYLLDDAEEGDYEEFIYKDRYDFGVEGLHDGKCYALNIEIYEEIYRCAKNYIDSEKSFNYYLQTEIDTIKIGINGCLTSKDKIAFLKEKHWCLWNLVKGENAKSFLHFMDSSKDWDYENWEHYVTETLTCESDYMELYLTSCEIKDNFDSYFYDTFVEWMEFYRIKTLINFCKSAINEINAPAKEKDKEGLEEKIFKDDGLRMFHFINSRYEGEINTAFYNYLYFYLRKLHKIKSLKVDNVDYRTYILKNEFLQSYTRVSEPDKFECKAKKDANDDFDKILKSYSVSD